MEHGVSLAWRGDEDEDGKHRVFQESTLPWWCGRLLLGISSRGGPHLDPRKKIQGICWIKQTSTVLPLGLWHIGVPGGS